MCFLKINNAAKTMELYIGKRQCTTEFVLWRFPVQHVLVYTIKRRCIHFIYITEYTLQIEACAKACSPGLPGTL